MLLIHFWSRKLFQQWIKQMTQQVRVTKEQDKIKEENRIKQALAKCAYPGWAVNKVKSDIRSKKNNPKRVQEKKSDSDRNKGMVVIPYVQSIQKRSAG